MSESPEPEIELPEPPPPGEPVLLLEAAGHWLGVPLPEVLEVVTPRRCTPLPGAPAAVLGLVNLRGRVVTVVDLAASAGLARRPEDAGRVVVVEHRGRRVGLAVADAPRILKIDPDSVAGPAAGDALPAVGATEVEGRKLVILDTEALLGPLLA